MTKNERNRRYRQLYRKKHGEEWYRLRYGVGVPSAQAFTNLPERLSRDDALAYYGRKLNKVWEEIYGKAPALNPESTHYSMVGNVEAIELMERMFTREELMAWAKLNAMKYRLRIGAKDDPRKEIDKIRTYEAYYRYLEAQGES